MQTPEAFAAKVADIGREAHVDVALWATVPPRGPIEHVGGARARRAPPRSSSRPSRPTRSASRGSPTASCCAAFTAIAAAGGLAGVHAENDEIVRAGIEAERAAGHGGGPARARALAPRGRRARGDRPLPRARAGHRRATARLPRLDAARRRARRGRARRRRRRQRRELPALPAARRVRADAPRRRGEDQPAAASATPLALRGPRPRLLRPRRLAGRAQARRRHLRARLGLPRASS